MAYEEEHKGKKNGHPLAWVPSLYFAEGIPYVLVMTIAGIMYKCFGLSNEDIAIYTSWLYLPWVIKPFWSPIVEIFGTKRLWIVGMQVFVGAALAGVAFTINAADYVQWTLAFFWLMAFSSATHDIAADGFYMMGLSENEQAQYVGIRSTFYRLSQIAAQGVLLWVAGQMENVFGDVKEAWSVTFLTVSALFAFIFFYHQIVLPRPAKDKSERVTLYSAILGFSKTIVSFILKPQFLIAITFMLLYRFPEALLVKISPLFLKDTIEAGGLGLTTAEIGQAQGIFGTTGLIAGGIIGGFAISIWGFRKCLWPMAFSITIPHAIYIGLAYWLPSNIWLISSCIAIEQFGYGFGFTAYMMYLIYFSQGEMQTAHYAFCTGLMALSMMIPGIISGWLQEAMGYLNFFTLILALTPLTLMVAMLIKVDADFGLKKNRQ